MRRCAPRWWSRETIAETAADRRRQIVRRADDIADAGGGAAARRAGLAFPRLSAASGEPPSCERGKHLLDVRVPMLFLQGTRDALAMPDQIEPMCAALGARATLRLFADADHSFHVPARSGRTDAQS
jgi:predicted alpha/beta-hydrolase family hydrolase